MYSIVTQGREIGMAENPTYIFLQENGYYALTDESGAQGIVHDGIVYQLDGRDPMGEEDLPVAVVTEVDAGERIRKQETTNSIAFVTLAEAGSIDDVTAGEHSEAFAEWAYPISYKTGQIRRYAGKLYRCVQDHTSQEDWTPDKEASLWTAISDPAEEWPEWSQPVGAHDAYHVGDKVSHGGKHWTCTEGDATGANVWEPGVFGWTEAKEE